MKMFCEFCGTEILLKQFITERRVDKEDKISSYNTLIENAKQNGDYQSVYGYYEEVCKLEPSKANLMYLNLYGYYTCKIPFNVSILNELYVLPLEQHKNILNEILRFANHKKVQQTNIVIQRNLPERVRNEEFNKINIEHTKVVSPVNAEINKLKPITCQCGGILEYNQDRCNKCGSTRDEIIYNSKFTTKAKNFFSKFKKK
jgi:hypothetical protein